jgi:hypothetical protein
VLSWLRYYFLSEKLTIAACKVNSTLIQRVSAINKINIKTAGNLIERNDRKKSISSFSWYEKKIVS